MSHWPKKLDYDAAILAKLFTDKELCNFDVKLRSDGNLRPSFSGGRNALTYRLIDNEGKSHAIKVFREDNPERSQRYKRISAFLQRHSLVNFAKFDFQETGLRCGTRHVPLVHMEWIDGKKLDTHIGEHIDNTAHLNRLSKLWFDLSSTCSRMNIGHGDLHHGNIIVNDSIKLIDYDGMYVPNINCTTAIEVGNEHYQHPRRERAHFDSRIDHFSQIIIFLSICVASSNREVYDYQRDKDYLLFKRADFIDPSSSQTFRKLLLLPQYADAVSHLSRICSSNYESIPSLASYIAANFDLGHLEKLNINVSSKSAHGSINSNNVSIGAMSIPPITMPSKLKKSKEIYYLPPIRVPNIEARNKKQLILGKAGRKMIPVASGIAIVLLLLLVVQFSSNRNLPLIAEVGTNGINKPLTEATVCPEMLKSLEHRANKYYSQTVLNSKKAECEFYPVMKSLSDEWVRLKILCKNHLQRDAIDATSIKNIDNFYMRIIGKCK